MPTSPTSLHQPKPASTQNSKSSLQRTPAPRRAAATSDGAKPDAASAFPRSQRKNTSDLHRLLKIITLLQSSPGWTIKRLAAETGVQDRTIFRDLKKLQGCGVPIEHERGIGGYRIQREFFLQPLALTAEEALALTALAESVAAKDQIAFLKPAHRAVAKLRAQLPASIFDSVETVRPSVVIHTAASSAGDDYQDVYDKVQAAIKAQRVLECEYESVGRSDEPADPFQFEPYALFFGIRAWYAVGKHRRHKEVRTLKLSRFSRVQITDEKYIIPASFSMEKHLGNAWGMVKGKDSFDVVVEFSGTMQDTVAETRWHRTQQVDFDPDRNVTRLSFKVDGLDEIVWWVLGMGPGCKVLKPAQLADRVRQLAQETAAVYASGASSKKGTK